MANTKARKRKPKFVAHKDDLTVTLINEQRNGISGRPFTAVFFTDNDIKERMMAVIPDGADGMGMGHRAGVECFVVSLDRPEEAWRGDYYMSALQEHLAK